MKLSFQWDCRKKWANRTILKQKWESQFCAVLYLLGPRLPTSRAVPSCGTIARMKCGTSCGKKAFKMKKAIIITSSSGNVRQAAIKKAVKGKSRPLRKNQSLPLMEQLRPQCNLIAMICDLFTGNYSTVDIAVKRWLITWLKSKMAYSCPSDVVVVVPLLLHCSLVHWSNQANETMIRCCWESQVISLSIPLAMLHFSAVTAQLVQNKCTTRLVGYKRKVIFGKMSSLWTCCSWSKIVVL